MRLRVLIVLALAAALAVPALAQASADKLIKDCANDGVINGTYSPKDYSEALDHLPADVDEYSDCRDQIRRGELSAGSKRPGSGGGGGGGTATGGGAGGTGGGTTGGGGATGDGDTGTGTSHATDPLATATPQEVASFQKAVDAGDAPVKLDGRPISPTDLGGAKTQSVGDLPTALLVMLVLLAVAGFGAAGLGTRRLLVHGRRTT